MQVLHQLDFILLASSQLLLRNENATSRHIALLFITASFLWSSHSHFPSFDFTPGLTVAASLIVLELFTNISIYVYIPAGIHLRHISTYKHIHIGEKFGILRLLRIYHSTSRVKGLGFDLILNLGAGSENHCVQKKWTAVLHFSHRL